MITPIRANGASTRSGRLLGLAGRLLLVSAAWVTSIVVGAAGYGAIEERQRLQDIVAFACSFAIAAALSPILPLALGGKGRRALESTVAIVGLTAILVAFVYVNLWLNPSLSLRFISVRHLLGLREMILREGAEIGRFFGLAGAMIGILIGVLAGILTLLARWKRRLAIGLAMVLLILCASGAAQHLIFGIGADLFLEWRRGDRATSYITSSELAAALGATAGGLLGALAAGLALWQGRGSSRGSEGSSIPPERGSPDPPGRV